MSKENTVPSEPIIHTEYEVKVLEIDESSVSQKLVELGAEKILDAITYIEGYDYIPDKTTPYKSQSVSKKLSPMISAIDEITDGSDSLLSHGAYLRLREEGERCEVILKYRADDAIDGIKTEQELSVPIRKDEWDEMRDGLASVGLHRIVIQEKKRTSFLYSALELRFDIDTWPQVPTYLEVEAPTEDVISMGLHMLGFDRSQATSMTGKEVFEKYHVDPTYLVFNKNNEN